MCCKQQLHAFAKERSKGEEIFNWNSGKRDPLHRHAAAPTTYRVAIYSGWGSQHCYEIKCPLSAPNA
jgi:hypothetical protein